MRNIFLTMLTCLCITSNAQDYYNEALYDSLKNLSNEALIDMAKSGYDFNTPISIYEQFDEEGEVIGMGEPHTAFQQVTHSYGFYCDDSIKPLIYGLIEHSEKQLINPLYFTDDPCGERVSDILEYFSLLKRKAYKVDENTFKELLSIYYDPYDDRDNYQNEVGKSPLMYAIEFGYVQSIEKMLKNNKDINLADHNGQSLLMYACASDNIALINTILKKKPKLNTDKEGKEVIEYCISPQAKDLIKKYKKKK
jgi:hypothetical protein